MPITDYRVQVSEDDGCIYQYPSGYLALSVTDAGILIGNKAVDPFVTYRGMWVRVQLDIPQYASIVDAHLRLNYGSITNEGEVCRALISMWDVGNAGQSFSDYLTKPRTAASVPWEIPLPSASYEFVESPNFAEVLQSIVNRPDYAPGNYVAVLVDNNGSDPGAIRGFINIDWTYTTGQDAVLSVDYTLEPVLARFSADRTVGQSPLDVQFTDESIGTITSWAWDFGDGTTSVEQNPLHTFQVPDIMPEQVFTVILTVSGPDGQSSGQMDITVSPAAMPLIVPEDTFFWNPTELQELRSRVALPSHQPIWNALLQWAEQNLNATPPVEPSPSGLRRYILTMGFMFAMTEDARFGEAAIRWLVSMADWTTWTNVRFGNIWQIRSSMLNAAAIGYNMFRDSLSALDRTRLRDKIIEETLILWNEYYPRGMYWWWPNAIAVNGCAIGMAGLAIQDEHLPAQAWVTYAMGQADRVIGNPPPPDTWQDTNPIGIDGGFPEGQNYYWYTLTGLIPFFEGLKRSGGPNKYNDRLGQSINFPIYMTYNDGPVHLEDLTWWSPADEDRDETTFMYRLASEYNNGYAQDYADKHFDINNTMLLLPAFLWKDPSISATPISDLPLTRHFRDMGYVVMRSGWTSNDLLMVFKSGVCLGHSHQSQNEFVMYWKGCLMTAGVGYSYLNTIYHNCILIGDEGTRTYNMIPGQIVTADIDNPYYKYALGDATPVYEGALDKCLRHMVFVEPDYFVIYDQVSAPAPAPLARQIIAPQITRYPLETQSYGGVPKTISITENTITITQGGGARYPFVSMQDVVVKPESFWTERVNRGDGFEGSIALKVYESPQARSTDFLNVIFPDNALPVEEVEQNNAVGVIVRGEPSLDLILFSTDGLAVDEYIELGDYYEPVDGQMYDLVGTTVRAQFNNYQVMRLRRTTSARVTLTISAGPGGTTEPVPGASNHDQDSEVPITAIPSPDYQFVEWQEGGVSLGSANPLTLPMPTDRAVTAVFEAIVVPPTEFAVSISVIGNGITDPVPGTYQVVAGESLLIQAIPASGFKFDRWDGSISGTDNPVTVTPLNNMSIVAIFVEKTPARTGLMPFVPIGATLLAAVVSKVRR